MERVNGTNGRSTLTYDEFNAKFLVKLPTLLSISSGGFTSFIWLVSSLFLFYPLDNISSVIPQNSITVSGDASSYYAFVNFQ